MDYKEINKEAWNQKVDIHYRSEFYDNDNFINGKSSLNSIELDILGDIKDKSLLHLQCHFGQDTISLSRMGASTTGVDLSDKAINTAKQLATQTGSSAKFVCSDIYDLPNNLEGQYDIVFTSYGTIGWLPDIDKWASVVSKFLKPGGQFLIVDFHPVVWMYDDDFTKVTFRYFNDAPIIEETEGTYADTSASLSPKTISWNHGLAEIMTSLIRQGLQIRSFGEYDYSPYNCFSNMIEVEKGKFRIQDFGNKIPIVYAIEATKG